MLKLKFYENIRKQMTSLANIFGIKLYLSVKIEEIGKNREKIMECLLEILSVPV